MFRKSCPHRILSFVYFKEQLLSLGSCEDSVLTLKSNSFGYMQSKAGFEVKLSFFIVLFRIKEVQSIKHLLAFHTLS